MKLLFFICCSKQFGSRVLNHKTQRTQAHGVLKCQAYQCRDYEEFMELQGLVKKLSQTLWCDVRLQDAEGVLHLPTLAQWENILQGVSETGRAHSSPEAGATPAPASSPVQVVPEVPATQTAPDPAAATNEPLPAIEPVLEAVKGGARRTVELAAVLGIAAARLRELALANPHQFKLKQGGWLSLAEAQA